MPLCTQCRSMAWVNGEQVGVPSKHDPGDGLSPGEQCDECGGTPTRTDWNKARKKPVVVEFREVEEEETIETREGVLKAYPGDLIIKGVEGEVYPIDRDIFDETYEVL